METTKVFKVGIPEGYEIDMEKSSLTEGRIVFKKMKVPFSHYDGSYSMKGYFIAHNSKIVDARDVCNFFGNNSKENKNIFASEKFARKALAMAQLSQIIKHDDILKNYCFDIADPTPEQDIYIIEYNIIDKVFKIQKYFIKPKNIKYVGAEINFLTFWLPNSTYTQQSIKEAILSLIAENEQLFKDYFMVND